MKPYSMMLAICMIVAAVFFRLIPHPANFTPLISVALFSGALFKDKKLFMLIPALALFASDMVLGMHSLSLLIYFCFTLFFFFGGALKESLNKFSTKGLGKWVGSSIVAAALFFVISNLAVFLFSGMYPLTATGFTSCFTLAIPFFSNTLYSTVLFSSVFYSSYSYAANFEQSRKASTI